jgi:UDP-N-acetylmuramoyl-L-alanyl-D-glutamate--2,6-diaminopimelate ligase
MQWSTIAAAVTHEECVASSDDPSISGIQYDSRKVRTGDVFVAMRGGIVDGNRFIAAARAQGAAAVMTDDAESYAKLDAESFPALLVVHGRRALAEAARAFYENPASKLKISAVTGTNGKTTTAFLLEQLLRSAGRKCVLIGTIETRIGDDVLPSEHTTPEASDLLRIFAAGVAAGCTEVVMEMSSHALDQERVWGIPVDVAIFTNLTQDHLDYHGTMENYAAAKAKLFSGDATGAPPRVAVINLDDNAGPMMAAAAYEVGGAVMTYGLGGGSLPDGNVDVTLCGGIADVVAHDLSLSATDLSFDMKTAEGDAYLEAKLTGTVNAYNLLAAATAAHARGMSLREIEAGARTLHAVPGRFEVVAGSEEAGVVVVVDYAHTPDALENLLAIARAQSAGRVITMFGCGGDRDRTKRPKMGRAAGEGSDFVVVTSDNPRSEDPLTIIDEILAGLRETGTAYVVEANRHAAIALAIKAAQAGDIVLLAGKGHEKVQIFADGAVPFDDVAVASDVLRKLLNEGAE